MSNVDCDERTDIFIVGIMFIEMLTGRHPFNTGSLKDHDIHVNIVNLKFDMPALQDEAAVSFIRRTLCNAEHRLNRETVMKHRFIDRILEEHIKSFAYAPNVIDRNDYPPYNNNRSFFKNITGVHVVKYKSSLQIVPIEPVNPNTQVLSYNKIKV